MASLLSTDLTNIILEGLDNQLAVLSTHYRDIQVQYTGTVYKILYSSILLVYKIR